MHSPSNVDSTIIMELMIIILCCAGALAALITIGMCLRGIFRRNRNSLQAVKDILERELAAPWLTDEQRARASVELAQVLLSLPDAHQYAQQAHELLKTAQEKNLLLDATAATQTLILLADTCIELNDLPAVKTLIGQLEHRQKTPCQQAHTTLLNAYIFMHEPDQRAAALALIDQALTCKQLDAPARNRAQSLRAQLCTLMSCQPE